MLHSPNEVLRSRERGDHQWRSHHSRQPARFARPLTRTVEGVSDDEDAQLMLAYARGEMRAFETLYSRHRGALYRYLMRQARDGEIANDLFQEVWSRVIANRTRYEPRAKFRTFLFTLAHNCFIDHCRRMKSRPAGLGIEDADAADLLPAAEESRPEDVLQRNEATRRYRAALATLPPEQRDVYLLHEESDLSLEEIARVTGVGAETAKSRLRYAVAQTQGGPGRRGRPDMSGPDEEFEDFLQAPPAAVPPRTWTTGLEPPAELDRIVLRQAREAIEADRRCACSRAALDRAVGHRSDSGAGLDHRVQGRNAAVDSRCREVTVQNVAQRVE